MLIAITQRVVHNSSYPDDRDALSHDWVHFLEAILPGCVIVPVPNNIADCQAWMDAVSPDAVILSNGNDLDAAPVRDRCEQQVMRWALERKIQLLGVCRGLQFVNRYFGGGLTLDLSRNAGQNHVGCEHDIAVTHPAFQGLAGSALAKATVNSFHDHGVQLSDLAPGLTVFATAEDGTLEGLLHDEELVLAIQWHPERPGTDEVFGETLVRKFLLEGRFW